MLGVFHRGDVIRKIREKQGWTQAQLAKRAGLNVATVTRAEENQPQISLDTIGAIAKALGVPTDFLEQAAAEVLPTFGVAAPRPEAAELTGGRPMADTAKDRLLAFVSSLEEPEAAILLGLARQWLARLVLRDAGPPSPR